MSYQQNPYPGSSASGPSKDAALWDKICGGVSMVGGLCSSLLGLFATAIFGMFASMLNQASTTEPGNRPPAEFLPIFGTGAGMVLVVFLTIAALQFAIGFGMWSSRKWAFIAAIPVYGFCGITSAKSVIGCVVSLALVVYSICRLTGSIGPAPD
jgi:hypothetical protein